MRFPNKLYPFGESTLALFAPILTVLEAEPVSISELRARLDNPAIEDVLDALTALFALKQINLDSTTGVIVRAR
ncbi:ABC-three component system middle component 7 [Arcanobacterium pinnipediorum]|uniref:Uncharacterized protein n=1 Tax=Arcanobacterium pinnipediorum TaxID=1503041 RepID=A0ABY5AI13_9ACTO|nr:ABC-three component system middle component 7 [Arcanobacterium pinnipediorum]USR79847.1 hypothetical protein NG665_02370 [Arcanobacterium pinnipediorum]